MSGVDDWCLVEHPVAYADDVDCEKSVEAAGYERFDAFGSDYLGSMSAAFEVWARPRCEPYDFLVVWTTAESICPEVVARDLPSLLKLLQLLASLASQRDSSMFFGAMDECLRKAFHAWHGHRVDLACRQCDRAEHERGERRRHEREQLEGDSHAP